MRPAPCAFCQRVNPADSKFCNACGAPLPLVPCARCGAVNDPAATACYQCAAPLREAGAGVRLSAVEAPGAAGASAPAVEPRTAPIAQGPPGADGVDRDAQLFSTLQELERLLASSNPGVARGGLDGKSPGAATRDDDQGAVVTPSVDARLSYPAPAVASPTVRAAPRIVSRRRPAVVVGMVILAVLAAGGYYASRERPVPDVPAARGAVTDGGSPAATGGPVEQPASASGPAPATSTSALAVAPAPQGVAAIRPGTAAPGDARSPAAAPPAGSPGPAAAPGRPGAEAAVRPELAAPAAAARPRRADAGPGIIERPPRVGPCTDAVAALGLCAPESIQRRE
jgi:hypothetical protein